MQDAYESHYWTLAGTKRVIRYNARSRRQALWRVEADYCAGLITVTAFASAVSEIEAVRCSEEWETVRV